MGPAPWPGDMGQGGQHRRVQGQPTGHMLGSTLASLGLVCRSLCDVAACRKSEAALLSARRCPFRVTRLVSIPDICFGRADFFFVGVALCVAVCVMSLPTGNHRPSCFQLGGALSGSLGWCRFRIFFLAVPSFFCRGGLVCRSLCDVFP